jgi:Prokaryotic dksA/traR C4-type zinc finger
MPAKSRPCAVCGRPIPPGRLEALPQTRLCKEHAAAIEKYGGEFRSTVTRTRLGKEGSLKKNYGDVSVRRTRNAEALGKLREDHERAGRGES